MTEILSFLQIFSGKETTTQFFNITKFLHMEFWAFKSKLQIIHVATYIALFLL